MPSEVGFSVVTCGSSPISRSARPGFGPRANFRALPSAAMKSGSTPIRRATFISRRRPSPVISTRSSTGLLDETPDPGLDRRGIGRVVDGEHRALQHVGALLGEQAGKLRFLARFQDQDAVAVQSVSHDLALKPVSFDPSLWFILSPARGIGARAPPVIEQGRKSPFRPYPRNRNQRPCPTINSS